MLTIDIRYVILVIVLCASLILIVRRPQWASAATIALAATALTYSILFVR